MPFRATEYNLPLHLQRALQELELRPSIAHVQANASLNLTTTPTLVPNMSVNVPVIGNSIICLDLTVDLTAHTCHVGAICEVWNTPPGLTETTVGTSQQAILYPQLALDTIRATVSQTYTLLLPASGRWTFRALASVGAVSGTASVANSWHTNMRVMVF